MAILNWDGLSHYDFKMKAKITEWLNGKAEKVHTHTKSEVGLDQVDNTSDTDKPISTAQKKKFAEIDTAIAGKSPTGHKHTKSDITDFPTLGTASSKDVAATGNASATQVVMGNDSRLTDARKASDVQAWAKAENKPSYTKLEVGLGNVDNTSDTNKPVSTAQQTAIDTAYANANKYTDKKVADLIGSAPETMDTLEEVAAAIQENKDVEKALNEAIGKKANQTELDTHTGNSTIHITASERTKWNAAKTHADSAHARTDATKVEKSTTNGNIKINGTETTVYTHPSSHSIAEVSGLQTALDGKGTYSKPSGGIPKSDLASAVQTSLGKADTALQSHQDISGKQDKSTAVTHKASTAVGSATQPVYIASDGSATATTYTLGKSVPSDAKFTDTVYDDATTSAHGLMTAAMVTKLNGIVSGANKTTVDSELSSTSTNPVQNKVINTALAGKANSSHGNHVPATQTANNATFLRNDNTWAKVTPANIGAQPAGSYAATSHTHDDRYYTESEINTKLNGKANSSHTHGNGDITSLDAGKITSGTISIDRLPQGALERLTVVADDTARFKLTSSTIQKGDTVKVTSSGKMYYVVDETKLSSEAGYEVYAAGTAASVPWSGVTGKPSSYTPSSHTHTKTEVGLGNVDNTADSTKSVKYATSAGSAGWATKATAIVDYAQTSKNIQIGYNGNGIKGDEIKFIAGYTAGNGSDVTAKIKDVSKDALKSWLGLGSLAYSSASIPSVGNGTITITQNGTSKGTFTMNQSGNTTIALTDTNTDTNTVTNIGTAANNYTNGNILFQGSGATTVSKSGNTITISSTDTTYTLAGLMGSTAKGSSDYGVYWNGSSFVQTKHIPTVDNSATFTSGNPAASAAIMTNVLEHTMWLEKHVAISSYGTTTLCNLADQAASHTSGAYLVLISGMTSSCKSEIYLIYNMQNNNKTFYMQQVASAGGSSTACTLTISGTTLTATVQGNSAPYRNIFVFRCTI